MSSAAMTKRRYPVLSALLLFISIAVGVAGLSLLFETSWFYSLIIGIAPVGVPTDLLLKGLGALVLGLSYLAFTTSQDPERYVGVIDTLIFVLVVVVVLEIYEMAKYGTESIYPYHLLLLSTIVRALLACALLALRPRGV